MVKKPPNNTDAVFAALRAILEPYRDKFSVSDEPGHYSLDDHSVEGWSIDFAAVVAKRNVVSFYFMPARHTPALLDKASPTLLARRTKAGGFFNFKEVDVAHIAELSQLVATAFAAWDPIAITKR